jgi:drug/metabolite transporter (DMT)-like permease
MTRHRALIFIHIAALLFGLTGVFGQLIQASSGLITLGRATFAVVALAAFARASRRPLWRGLTWARLRLLGFAGLLLTAHWVTFFISVKTGGIAVATLGFASFPAFITLIERVVYKESIGPGEWFVLFVVTAGLTLVTPTFDFADAGTVGLGWGLASGLAFALLAISNRRAAAGIDPIQVAWWQNVVVVLVTLPFSLPLVPQLHAIDWLWLGLLGVLCTALSHYLFVASLTRLPARSAGMVIALEPVYAIAFAWALFAQEPSPRMLGGAALVVCGIILSGRRKTPASPPGVQQSS